ncbi:type III-B CRISPR module RAMP protein Cmr6 [Clostridium algidicarnis]|uniref:Type III-B CRISPR module RAMP protein Cmr6 n=1 Tax=Clostridium algidicarnis TaxID=37659 RepID=A0ABS6C2B3_9CLOT|nr:type III-B CRISPR module RAMP protein Cmr6 [Clostridium algidicarnis]MBU3219626.1 type III-B CRISPR module RAMP protein Cmr6 [Clostridium algidicarnis]
MTIGNIGYLYYKDNDFREKTSEIIKNSSIELLDYNTTKMLESIQSLYINKLYFKTTYPGLIVGTGYNHIIKEKDAFKLGLEFDYTTGLPIINGSSVKGLLRSVFYNKEDSKNLKEEKQNYIKDILKELNGGHEILEDFDFEKLTNNIFEGKCLYKDDIYKPVPINERDIFFGATIDINKTIKEKTGKDKYLLGEDYITPHGTGEQKLKNPIPIKFLKVMPNVVWCFGFDLKDSYNSENKELYITKDIKKKMFNKIILDLGIGSKTNVGYGRFDEHYSIE